MNTLFYTSLSNSLWIRISYKFVPKISEKDVCDVVTDKEAESASNHLEYYKCVTQLFFICWSEYTQPCIY